MAVSKLSQIAASGGNPATTDTVVGVGGGTTDLQYTLAQLAATIGANLSAISGTSLTLSDNATFTTAAKGIVLKQGSNGRVGTFVANGATPVAVLNSSVAITDAIIISLNTVGGVGPIVQPFVTAITAGVGFSVAATTGDTSTYNYAIIKNAA